jgi:hypothetical protein
MKYAPEFLTLLIMIAVLVLFFIQWNNMNRVLSDIEKLRIETAEIRGKDNAVRDLMLSVREDEQREYDEQEEIIEDVQ